VYRILVKITNGQVHQMTNEIINILFARFCHFHQIVCNTQLSSHSTFRQEGERERERKGKKCAVSHSLRAMVKRTSRMQLQGGRAVVRHLRGTSDIPRGRGDASARATFLAYLRSMTGLIPGFWTRSPLLPPRVLLLRKPPERSRYLADAMRLVSEDLSRERKGERGRERERRKDGTIYTRAYRSHSVVTCTKVISRKDR